MVGDLAPDTKRLAPSSLQPPATGSADCSGVRNRFPLVGSDSALANRLPSRSDAANCSLAGAGAISTSPMAAPMCISQMHAVDGQASAMAPTTRPKVRIETAWPPSATGRKAASRPLACSSRRLSTGSVAVSSSSGARARNLGASSATTSSQPDSSAGGSSGSGRPDGIDIMWTPPR